MRRGCLILVGLAVVFIVLAIAFGGPSEAPAPASEATAAPTPTLITPEGEPPEEPPAAATPTLAPSATPIAATATPVPATATPEPEKAALEILSASSYEEYDWLHIVGEVVNNSSTPMQFVEVVVTLYDAHDSVVGTGFTYTELDVIPPGGKAPFNIGADEYSGAESYKLQVQGRPGELARQDLRVGSHRSRVEYDWLHILGEVQNTGSSDAEWVKIVATLYDAAGKVIGMGFTYADLDLVPAGGTSPFDMGIGYWEGFDHYELLVQGR